MNPARNLPTYVEWRGKLWRVTPGPPHFDPSCHRVRLEEVGFMDPSTYDASLLGMWERLGNGSMREVGA